MRRTIMCLVAFVMVATGAGVAVASPASADGLFDRCPAGRFCAFNGDNFSARILNTEPGIGNIHVPRDQTNSMINHTGYYICAVNDGFPWNSTIWSVPPGDHVETMGSQNNRTDWFYRRTPSQGCDS